MKKTIAILGIATLAAAGVSTVQAGHVSINIGGSFSLPLPPLPLPFRSASVHVAPRGHIAPPVFVQSAPVVCAPPMAPVARYYVPPPVIVQGPPVVIASPSCYLPAPRFGFPEFGFNFRFRPQFNGHHSSHSRRW
jgi:hypothetical protein